jgi:hypothetical protein
MVQDMEYAMAYLEIDLCAPNKASRAIYKNLQLFQPYSALQVSSSITYRIQSTTNITLSIKYAYDSIVMLIVNLFLVKFFVPHCFLDKANKLIYKVLKLSSSATFVCY